MALVRIDELSRRLDVSSRSLRYYEQVGLLHSERPPLEKYRYYDEENIERLRQIVVLRRMQIPVKDILRIYESQDMRVLVEAFVGRLSAIDEEITALSELRRVVDAFLQAMVSNGITRISALPLLYDEMGRQLRIREEEPPALARLEAAAERLERPPEVRLTTLPPMRALTSVRADTGVSDVEGLWAWLAAQGVEAGPPGARTLFEYDDAAAGTVLLLRVPEDLADTGPYAPTAFEGGLYAVADMYADEDMASLHRRMIASFDGNAYYEVDYGHGDRRRQALLETVRSPDRQRERVALYLPVKERAPDAALYAPGTRAEGMTAAALEAANPVLWSRDIPMDGFKPILFPRYRVLETGEAEYAASVDKRRLSTEVAVRVPFRVDVEFRIDAGSGTFANGADEGSIRIYHGENMYAVNMDNNADSRLSKESIHFNQPVFGDLARYPGLGKITPGVYNHLTWIVGERQLAAIIDGEVRYCGVGMPYMTLDPRTLPRHTIAIGSNGKGRVYLRAMRVAQLRETPRMNIQEGALRMATRQSNNMIPKIHRVITMHYGENFWFNGCAKYVMEALGEPEMDYWFFAGLTGDSHAQVFSYDRFRGDGALDYRISDGDGRCIAEVFDACGYASTFVDDGMLRANREMYLQTLMAYIDRGVPVISNLWRTWDGGAQGFGWAVFVGYEDYGRTLLYLTADKETPERVSLDDAIPGAAEAGTREAVGWIFVGEKRRDVDLAQVYRQAVLGMRGLLTTRTAGYCFGAEAFRAWAAQVEGGRFDGMRVEDFDEWAMYKIYVCDVATIGSCRAFLERALEKNPDMGYLAQVLEAYRTLGILWEGSRERPPEGGSLESNGGGFNATLAALQDPAQRARIAGVIRAMADQVDRVLSLLP